MGTDALRQPDGVSRRDFLFKAAIGLAAAVGLGVAVRRRLSPSDQAPMPLELEEDSIFTPRADQRDRVLGRK